MHKSSDSDGLGQYGGHMHLLHKHNAGTNPNWANNSGRWEPRQVRLRVHIARMPACFYTASPTSSLVCTMSVGSESAAASKQAGQNRWMTSSRVAVVFVHGCLVFVVVGRSGWVLQGELLRVCVAQWCRSVESWSKVSRILRFRHVWCLRGSFRAWKARAVDINRSMTDPPKSDTQNLFFQKNHFQDRCLRQFFPLSHRNMERFSWNTP